MAKRSELSAAQRREAVLALLRREELATVLARRFGIAEQTLYRWRDEFLAGGEVALTNGKKELTERDQVISELTIATQLLKKCRAVCFNG